MKQLGHTDTLAKMPKCSTDLTLFLNDRRRAALERLRGWTIPKHPKYNWPEWKYEAMNELLQHQVREILK